MQGKFPCRVKRRCRPFKADAMKCPAMHLPLGVDAVTHAGPHVPFDQQVALCQLLAGDVQRRDRDQVVGLAVDQQDRRTSRDFWPGAPGPASRPE